MSILDHLNARLAVKKAESISTPSLPFNYVGVESDLVQKGGTGSGRHKGDFDGMHPLDYYNQGGFHSTPKPTTGTHHTKDTRTGEIAVHGSEAEMTSHVKTLNNAYGAGKFAVGKN